MFVFPIFKKNRGKPSGVAKMQHVCMATTPFSSNGKVTTTATNIGIGTINNFDSKMLSKTEMTQTAVLQEDMIIKLATTLFTFDGNVTPFTSTCIS